MTLKFEKHNKNHAISEFIASIRFANPVSAVLSAQIASKAQEIAQDLNLPAPFSQPMFSFALGAPFGKAAHQVSAQPQPQPMQTIGFQRFSANGEPEARLICEPNAITLTAKSYPGWEGQLVELVRIFSALALVYIRECPLLAEFKLQYINEFKSINEGFISASEIFRKPTKWVTLAGRQSDNLWHSHSGRFISQELNRLLVNVNADVTLVEQIIPPSPRTQVKVLILVSQAFDAPSCDLLVATPESLSTLLSKHFDDLHTQEKKILAEVFSDNYLSDIGAV